LGTLFRHRWGLLLAFALGVDASSAHAAGSFEPLDDGLVLSQSSVQALAQDREGYLWIGTQAGLDRYDGYRIRSWKSRPDDPDTLSFGFVTDLLVASDDAVWVASGGGLDRLDPLTREVTRMPVQLADGSRERERVGTLVEDGNGDVYAASGSEMQPLRWRPGRRTLTPVAIDGVAEPAPPARPNTKLLRDRAGRIWLAARQGLWRLDRSADRFVPVLVPERASGERWTTEHIVAAGPGRGIVYASIDGLYRIEPGAERPVRLLRPTDHGLASDWVHAVTVDASGATWLAQPGALVRIDPDSGRWRAFAKPKLDPDNSENAGNHAIHTARTPNGDIWLAGLFGLVRYDVDADELRVYRHDPNNPSSPPPTVAEIGYRILVDRFGVLWVGGNLGGLAKLGPHSERFVHVRDLNPSVTNRNIIRAIAEQSTADGEFVWTAAQNHGVTAWRRTGPRDYRIERRYAPGGPVSQLGIIRHIVVDPNDAGVWLAGHRGLGRIAGPGGALEILQPTSPDPPVNLRFADFLDDGRLVVAGGAATGTRLWFIDTVPDGPRVTRRIRLDADAPQPHLFHFVERANGDLVAAGGSGITIIDPESGEASQHSPSLRPDRSSRDQVFMLAPDGDGGLWAGTRGAGLLHIRFIGDDQPVFSRLTSEDGLPDDTVYGILRDRGGTLWLSTNRGIVRFDPDRLAFAHYTPGDGVQGWEFNHTVAHVGASGRFYFGGVSGWNAFRPGDVRPLLQPPSVDLAGVRVNDDAVATPGGRLPPLSHDRNRLVIDYVGLHFAEPARVRYEVRLAGVDEDWIDAGTSRQARYASLAPGSYRFEVRAANLDGIWSAPRTLLQFEIRQPPWATPWAWALYAVATVLLVLALLARQKYKRRQLQTLVDRRTNELREQKNLVDRQARELERALEARTTLFANISHEFRTPLTLIRASIDKLAERPDPAAAAMGRKYVARLLRLVEQLLDLSRLRMAEPSTTETPWRLDTVVSQTVAAFRSVAEQRGIEIDCRINGSWHALCRQELVEKILLNLLGNAVKFTPPGGRVSVSLEPGRQGVQLSVADTGPGIPEHEQQRIFERFYRTRATERERQTGAGIGLALVFEAVRATAGRIDVSSRPGAGARFTVTLPASRPDASTLQRPATVDRERQRLDLAALAPDRNETAQTAPATAADADATLLVVEDNTDLRRHLAGSLAGRWRVLEAADGAEGRRLAREHGPDLIVTDLMMPRMDGFGMLQRLREDVETSHIPVLFLTARQDDRTRLKAYSLSADGFLSKPFKLEELTARIEQMLRQRARLRAHLRARLGHGGPTAEASRERVADRDALSERDRKLLATLDDWLARHHGDADADIQAMADALHVTARTLQRKLRSLADTTPAAYLRDYRMARARELLADPRHTVTEVAHAVGYSSSQYFSRAFRKVHGEPPETWRSRAEALTD
jgi:signal transduction histidine kinase/DNA-binding response OmpR family regulator/ligand-binding sensor domain-containing protein